MFWKPLKLPLKGFAKDPQKIKSEVTGPSVGKVGRTFRQYIQGCIQGCVGLLIKSNIFFHAGCFPSKARDLEKGVGGGEANGETFQRLMNFILFLKKRKVCHTRQKKRRNANGYKQTTGPPTPPSPFTTSTGSKVGSHYNQNQRSNTTRLTLFWLCLLSLKTSDDLNAQNKTDSLVFFFITFIWTKNFPLTSFVHLADGTNETGKFTAIQIHLIT